MMLMIISFVDPDDNVWAIYSHEYINGKFMVKDCTTNNTRTIDWFREFQTFEEWVEHYRNIMPWTDEELCLLKLQCHPNPPEKTSLYRQCKFRAIENMLELINT